MRKTSATDFYLKIILWTFFCLGLAGIYSLIKTVVIEVDTNGNESCTRYNIQTIQQLQTRYAAKHQGNFAPNFDELIKAENFDTRFTGENPVVDGYIFEMKVSEPTNQKPAFFSIIADPLNSDCGRRHFYYDSTLGAINVTEENRQAKAGDPTI